MKLLLVEDEKDLSASIASYLKHEDYIIERAHTYTEAEEKITINGYECALIDLMLPDGNGLNLVKQLKDSNKECGIIIISAKESLEDKITGLNIGADDYITKPFHLAELNARIKSVIRRKLYAGGNQIVINELKIDINTRDVKINESVVKGQTDLKEMILIHFPSIRILELLEPETLHLSLNLFIHLNLDCNGKPIC